MSEAWESCSGAAFRVTHSRLGLPGIMFLIEAWLSRTDTSPKADSHWCPRLTVDEYCILDMKEYIEYDWGQKMIECLGRLQRNCRGDGSFKHPQLEPARTVSQESWTVSQDTPFLAKLGKKTGPIAFYLHSGSLNQSRDLISLATHVTEINSYHLW